MQKSLGWELWVKSILLLALLSFCSNEILAQRDVIDFNTLNVEDGLAQNSVYAILKDHKGFMWFGTDDGLNRYDGYSFKSYTNKIGIPGTISNNRAISIIEDSNNVIWVGTIGGGLNKYIWSTDSFISYQHNPNEPNSLSNNRIMTLCEDTSGKIWIGTADGGLNLFDPKTETFELFINNQANPNLLPSNVIRSLLIDSANNLWVGTDNGIAVFDRETKGFNKFEILNSDGRAYKVKIVRRIFEDRDNNIWFATEEHGLIRYSISTKEFKIFTQKINDRNSILNNAVHDLYQDEDGVIWIATFGGLSKFDGKNNGFTNYTHDILNPYSISSNYLRTIYGDNTGIIWIGSNDNGISKFDKKNKKFTIYRNFPGNSFSFNSSTVRSIHEDSFGKVWIGTYGEGLIQFNPSNDNFKYFKSKSYERGFLPNNYINSISEDKRGNLWLATNNGIVKFNATRDKFTHYHQDSELTDGLLDNKVRFIFVDSQDVVWAAMLNFGLAKLLPNNETFKHYRYEQGSSSSISQDRLTTLFEDSKGNFWVGTSNEGLNLFDREIGMVVRIFKKDLDNPNAIISSRILCMHEDIQNRLWIGTAEGLSLFDYDTETFKNFTTLDGLPNDVVYGILEDELGRFWLSTNNGVSCFTYSAGAAPSFRNFDKYDGFPSNEFSEGSFCKLKDGTLLFGGINNFIAFEPSKIKDNQYLPIVYITEARVLNKNVGEGAQEEVYNLIERDSLVFNHSDNNISFYVTVLHYSTPEKNRYKYMLEGFDNTWYSPQNYQQFVKYTNLKPGKYTFRVIARNPDGIWNEKGDTFHFTIKQPFWSSWWFYVILSLVFYVIIYSIIRIRDARLIQSKIVLEEMVAQRTQEISAQSKELLLQTEKLHFANEEILAKSSILEEQNTILQAKNDEITIQRNELEEQKNSLANLAWELQDKNEEITAQRNEIERQKKEITDSIQYALRIQNAVLPSQEQIKEIFPEFFIFNRPKSIVSGDFYWATRIGKYRVIAVVDCTGHGVPGGFMSMLGVLMLNEVISLRGIIDPAKALNQLRQGIISVLHQRGEITDTSDGMDLSLCIIDDQEMTLTYSGANSSIIVFDPEKEGVDVIAELRSDRMPIAYHFVMKSFSNQTIKLTKGSILFLYTDGITDQFGWETNKKFQQNRLREFVISNKDLPLETQGMVLEQKFMSWMGSHYQVDDVLVMGLKI
jgi:ligand-binding sensor domain-containing protein/serine phosphatase RsbU (regulator of sigma subunit)